MATYPPPTPARVTIRELPTTEQPAARLRRYGPATLSSAELLTIVLNLRDFGQAETLLTRYGSLGALNQAPLTELMQQPGLGPQRAAKLKAAGELGRRLTSGYAERVQIRSSATAAHIALAEMADLEQEELRVFILDTKMALLKFHTVYVGSLNTAVVRIAEVFREAIRLNAAALIVVHNHPSGDPTPSSEDVYVTRQLIEAGKLLSIDVLDHLVIGHNQRWVALKERGLGF